jgi:hypothetical protein
VTVSRLLAVALCSLLGASGCVGQSGFHCSNDSQCSGGACELSVGYCSVADSMCPSGRRFVDLAGDLSGTCVAQVVTPDAGPPLVDLHIEAVQVANDDTTHQADITPAQVTTLVDAANAVYAVAGVHFSFDQINDFTSVNSTLINQMTGVSDTQWSSEEAAGNAIAAAHPGKATIFFRYGPGSSPTGASFSWTDYDFAAMPGYAETTLCSHTDTTRLAHELGHYLGLAHTFANSYATTSDAMAAYAGDPSVFDGDGITDTPPDPFVMTTTIQCDSTNATLTLSGTIFPLPRDDIMSYYDSAQKTLSPTQGWRVRQGALVRSGQDIRLILEGTFLPAFEGEALVGSASATGGTFNVQQMRPNGFLGNWSGDAQIFWGATAGATLTLTVNVPTAGTYRLWAVFTEAPDFGIFQVAVDGDPAGAPVDLFGTRVAHAPPRDLGMHTFAAGGNTITVHNTGQNPKSANTRFGLDYLLVQTGP